MLLHEDASRSADHVVWTETQEKSVPLLTYPALIREHCSGLAEVRKWQGILKIKSAEKVGPIIAYKILHDRIQYCGTYTGGPKYPSERQNAQDRD